jgi:hypothetical protein
MISLVLDNVYGINFDIRSSNGTRNFLPLHLMTDTHSKVKQVKVNFTLELGTKVQRGSRGIVLLFL